MRCCEGETYVQPNAPRPTRTDGDARGQVPMGWRQRIDFGPDVFDLSWVVLCFDCDAVLAVVDGVEREEVYAEL